MHDNYVEILKGQKKELVRLMAEPSLIERREVAQIDLDSHMAQIVVGVRRCGKSVLCRMALAKGGVNFGYSTPGFSNSEWFKNGAGSSPNGQYRIEVGYPTFEKNYLSDLDFEPVTGVN